jgi:hypothetical protein
MRERAKVGSARGTGRLAEVRPVGERFGRGSRWCALNDRTYRAGAHATDPWYFLRHYGRNWLVYNRFLIYWLTLQMGYIDRPVDWLQFMHLKSGPILTF